jgi:hypothetical protein
MTGLRTRGIAVEPQTCGLFALSANLLGDLWDTSRRTRQS